MRRLYVSLLVILLVAAMLTFLFFYPTQKTGRPITCESDEQCGGIAVSETFCRDGNLYGNGQANKCLNPGTEEAVCETSYGAILVEECESGCENNACI